VTNPTMKSPLRERLESMEVGDTHDVTDKSSNQVAALAYLVKKIKPESKFSCRTLETCVRVSRVA